MITLDGDPVDIATLVVAVCSCVIRPIRRAIKKKPPYFSFQPIAMDFLNGTVIVPFFLLIGSAFSKELLKNAIESNKLFFAIGGTIGLFYSC